VDLMHQIAGAPVWLSAIIIVVIPTTIAVLGPAVVRRFLPRDDVGANNEVAGFKFATLGVVYAVILGLAVISVWEKFAEAESAATREAATVAALFRLSTGLGDPDADRFRSAIDAYGTAAVAHDWPAMAEGTESRETLAALNALYVATFSFDASTPRGAAVLGASLDELDLLTDARRERLGLAEGSVPAILWFTLFVGAAMTVGFTFFFGLPNLGTQMLMTGMLAVVIFLSLFVAAAIDHPFTGSISVQPDALKQVLDDF
jgi:ABC-type amino acid transport system permease subunit